MEEEVGLRCSEYVASSAKNRIKIVADAVYYDILFHVDELENKLDAARNLETKWIVIAVTCEDCGREVEVMVFDHEPDIKEVHDRFICGNCLKFTLFKNIVENRFVKVKEF